MSAERLAHYAELGRPLPMVELLHQLARHAAVANGSIAGGNPSLTRGAAMLATVTALRVAATATPDAATRDLKIGALRAFLDGLPAERHRAHVAALVDAAIREEDEQRVSSGLPRHAPPLSFAQEHRIRRDAGPDTSDAPGLGHGDEDLYARAAFADDVDLVLAASIEIIADLVELPSRDPQTDGAFEALALAAFALCVRPDHADVQVVLRILHRTISRRRPIAAAILGARLRRCAAAAARGER